MSFELNLFYLKLQYDHGIGFEHMVQVHNARSGPRTVTVPSLSTDGAAQQQQSVDAEAQEQQNIDVEAPKQRSVDDAAQEQKSVDAAAQEQKSVDDAAQEQEGVDAEAQQRQTEDDAAQEQRNHTTRMLKHCLDMPNKMETPAKRMRMFNIYIIK